MQTKWVSNELNNYVIKLRRHFHQYPELSSQEYETTKVIQRELNKMGIENNVFFKTGVVAEIKGHRSGRTVALRADIDALPVIEKNTSPYCSKNIGLMHACGHDSHTAMLLGAAKILKSLESELEGNIRLIFQPAEETGEATVNLKELNVLDRADSILSLHVAPDLPTGKVSIEPGPRMAGVDDFTIKVISSGGHGATPHLGTDAVLTAAHLVVNLQEVVSREMDPFDPVVLTVGKLISGVKANILAKEAEITGNIRFFRPELREQFPSILERIASHTAKMFRSQAKVIYTPSLSPVINDPAITDLVIQAVKNITTEDVFCHKAAATTSEDFSRYLEIIPGALVFLGTSDGTPDTSQPLHHEFFEIDESALSMGVSIYVQYALDFLKQ